MKNIATGIDTIIIYFNNSSLDKNIAIRKLLSKNLFNMDINDLDAKALHQSKTLQYFAKEFGIYFKVSDVEIEIQFKSTFFAIATYDNFLCLKQRLRHVFNTVINYREFHIAQDFINLPVEKFFPKDLSRLKFMFIMFSEDPNYEFKSKYAGTRYLNGNRREWQIAIYDKTKELQDNAKRDTFEKQEYYRKKGYFDNEVTRVELRFKTKYCRKFFAEIESNDNEQLLCEKMLSYFYDHHKVRRLKKKQVYNPNHPERVNEWTKWKKLFKKTTAKIKSNELPRDAIFKNGHKLTSDDVVKKISRYSLKHVVNVEEIVHGLLNSTQDLLVSAHLRNTRIRKTQEHLRSLQPDPYS
jgi:hypothetical protein